MPRQWKAVFKTVWTTDRLKASELFAKAAGAFIHIKPGEENSAAFGESHGEDVIIYLPEQIREENLQVPDEWE